MERIKQSNTQSYSPAEVLISLREPFNKNTLWIHPHDGIVEFKVFNKGWKPIASNEDKGLSKLAADQVQELFQAFQNNVFGKFKKQLGKYSSDSLALYKKEKDLEWQIAELEKKIHTLNKRYQTMLVKLNNVNGK